MNNFVLVLTSLVILLVGVLVAWLFNNYITDSENGKEIDEIVEESIDAQTAWRVAVGNAATGLIILAPLFALWWHHLRVIASPFWAALSMLALFFLAFGATGIPMIFGDAQRSKDRRLRHRERD